MRKAVFIAAAASVMLAGPAVASGYIGAAYDWNQADDGFATTEAETWQGEGAFGFSGGHWGAQVDGAGGSSDGFDFWTLAGHAYWAGTGWRLGGVIATTQLDVSALIDIDETVYGIEATHDFGPNTVGSASVTMGEVDIATVTSVDIWNVDVGINHYIGSKVRLGGTIGIGNLSSPVVDGDTFSAGINAEFQPWSAPVSFTVGYSYFTEDSPPGLDTTSFAVGVRWSFGAGSLRDRDSSTPFDTRTGLYQRVFDLR
jgi:hypothetical protein